MNRASRGFCVTGIVALIVMGVGAVWMDVDFSKSESGWHVLGSMWLAEYK